MFTTGIPNSMGILHVRVSDQIESSMAGKDGILDSVFSRILSNIVR